MIGCNAEHGNAAEAKNTVIQDFDRGDRMMNS